MITLEELAELIEEEFKLQFVSTTAEFYGTETGKGLWLSAENGECIPKGTKRIFDYYTEDYKNYQFGVHNKFNDFIEERGYYAEWHDPGTIMIYPI